MPLVSVVIPVLDDEAAMAVLLAQIHPDPRLEIVVAAVAEPASPGVFRSRPDVRRVVSPAGRGRQMNAGAVAAAGDWLLFLHADSTLPPAWLDLIITEGLDSVGGWFGFALDDRAWQARIIEWGVGLRVRLFRLPYGDQGLFVRRDVFEALGGFRELPLMEDVDFVRRLVAAGRVVQLSAPLVTSARRWHRDGWWRRSVRNLLLIGFYFAGVSPHRLARYR